MTAHRHFLATLFLSLTAVITLAGEGQMAKVTQEEQWTCKFATTTTSQPESGKDLSSTTKKSETIITLAPSYFSVSSPEGRLFADFSSEAFYGSPSAEKKLFAGDSCFATAWFRVIEFQHRKALEAGKEAGRITAKGTAARKMFELETFFGVQTPPRGQPKVVDATKMSGGWDFKHKDRVIASVTYSSHGLPKPIQRSWSLFLAHNCRLHPEVRQILSQEVNLPQRLRFSYLDVDDSDKRVTTEYQLLSVRAEPVGKIADLLANQRFAFPDERLNRLLMKLPTISAPSMEEAFKKVVETVNADSREGHFLDAVLAAEEYLHQTGDAAGLRLLMKDLQPKLMTDPLASKFLSTKISSEKQTEFRKDVRLKKCQRLYVLDYLIADASLEEGDDPTKARDTLLTILEEHPLFCGALIDLGRTYIPEFNTYAADSCFRAARKLYPKHYALKDIDTLEQKIRDDFPEFFVAPDSPR